MAHASASRMPRFRVKSPWGGSGSWVSARGRTLRFARTPDLSDLDPPALRPYPSIQGSRRAIELRRMPSLLAPPLLLIDVDGVISLFGFPAASPPPGRFTVVDGTPHWISAGAGPILRDLAASFELIW